MPACNGFQSGKSRFRGEILRLKRGAPKTRQAPNLTNGIGKAYNEV